MRSRVLLTVCTVILLVSVCFCAVGISAAKNAERTEEAKASLNTDDEKLVAALSVIYAKAGNLMTALPNATITLSQTALMKMYAGDTDARAYFDNNLNLYTQNAFDEMDRIKAEYTAVINKYNGSAYNTKRTELEKMLDNVRSASTELKERTRALIAASGSDYDAYNAYCDQLQVLTDRLTSYSTKIDAEYTALMQKLLGNDFNYVS